MRELVSGVQDWTKRLAVEALNNVEEILPTDLVEILSVEFRVVEECDARRDWRVNALDVAAAREV